MKSCSPATLILTAVILVSIVIDLKLLPALKSFHISYAVWAFQNSNLIMYHLTTKCNPKKRRKMYLFLSSYQQSVQLKIYSKKCFYFTLWVCLLAYNHYGYIISECLLSCITLAMNDFIVPCGVLFVAQMSESVICVSLCTYEVFCILNPSQFWKLTHIVSIHTRCSAC